MSFCYKKILGVFTHLRVTTPNIIEPKEAVTNIRLLLLFFSNSFDTQGSPQALVQT